MKPTLGRATSAIAFAEIRSVIFPAGVKERSFATELVIHSDTGNHRSAIAMPVVDVGDMFEYFRRSASLSGWGKRRLW